MAHKPGDPQSSAAAELTQQQLELLLSLAARGALSGPGSLSAPAPIDLAAALSKLPRRTVAFPPCAVELLSLFKTSDTDEITGLFKEYFRFERHKIFGQDSNGSELDLQLTAQLDPALVGCLGGAGEGTILSQRGAAWPSECCLCVPCVTLDGIRNPSPEPHASSRLRRLFIGDAIWVHYFDRLGIHQILGVILDSFASSGRLPISNGAMAGIKDDVVALVLEVMIRQTKTGMSPGVRDRNCMTRTSLGWVTEGGRKLNLDTEVNSGFNTLFHKFIYHALEFYRDKRLAVAIQGAASNVGRPSVATLTTISDTLGLLTKRFEAFDYGRNYYNTLSSIVWTLAGLSVIRALRTTLGIPEAFNEAHEFVPAAYDLLVLKRPVTHGETNRYIVHRECARTARDIVIDLEVVRHQDASTGGALDTWLMQIESKVEAYRTAYRALTDNVDLGASPTPTIQQQA